MNRVATLAFACSLFASSPVAAGQAAASAGAETCIASLRNLRENSSSTRNDRHVIEWRADGCEVTIRFEGRPRFTADFTEIASLDGQGVFEIEEDGRIDRQLEIRTTRGALEFAYTVDRARRSFDADGKTWLTSVLQQLFRRTAYASKERVAWLLRRSGPDGVLAEIAQMPSAYPQHAYMIELLNQADPGRDVLTRMLKAAAAWDSDYYKAGLLESFSQRGGRDAELSKAAWAVVRSLGSDYYAAQATAALLKAGAPVTRDDLARILADLDSDYYRLTVVKAALGQREDMTELVLAAARETSSSYYRSEILTWLLEEGRPEGPALISVIRLSSELESDHYRARVLTHIARGRTLEGAVREAYVRAAEGIASQHYRRQALDALGSSPD